MTQCSSHKNKMGEDGIDVFIIPDKRKKSMSDLRINRFPNVSMVLRVTLLLVGVHSVMLGCTIYLFTVPFYQFFFSVNPDNFFFIKQAGIFLFLMGFFHLLPVLDMNRFRAAIILVVFSKVIAVRFLLVNANLTPSPFMIYLAALVDALMASHYDNRTHGDEAEEPVKMVLQF